MTAAPIRIVKAKWFREWFVEQDGGSYLCSLLEETQGKAYTIRSRGTGDWVLRANRIGNGFVASQSEVSTTADVASDSGKLVVHSSGGSEAFRCTKSGRSFIVANLDNNLYSYESGWKDSDAPRRICYHITPITLIPTEIRDLLLVMPLFWTGMNMHELPDSS